MDNALIVLVVDTLRRQTLKAIRQYKEETGESDFTSNESLFHFSDRNISNRSGLTVKVVREAIAESGLPFLKRGGSVFVWLPDLSERLEKAIEK